VCKACQDGRHRECAEGDCDCPSREEEEAIDRSITAFRQGDEELADMILSNLLARSSRVATMIADGAGRDNTKLFVQLVIRSYKSVNN